MNDDHTAPLPPPHWDAPPTAPPKRRRRRRNAAIGGGVLAALIAVGAVTGTDAAPGESTASETTAPRPRSGVTTATDSTAAREAAPTTPPREQEVSASAPAAPPPTIAPPPVFTVSSVVDGDTLEVTDQSGATYDVRLIGIDAPESGNCAGPAAAEAMAALVVGHEVVLTGGARDDVDMYGRLLRYADVAGVDVGRALIERGHATARYDSRDGYGTHRREQAYVAADAASPDWTCPAPPTAPATSVQPAPAPAPPAAPAPAAPPPTPPATSTYYANCDAARAAGAAPIHVGEPGYADKLDRDGDGVACE